MPGYMKFLTALLWGSVSSAFVFFSTVSFADSSEKRIIVGYVENVKIEEIEGDIKSKLDTGADTSSVHATIIEQDDDNVIFEIDSDSEDVEKKNIKKKIERIVRIKRKNTDDGEDVIRRPVVKMTFCIAGQRIEGEVNLSERDGFNYDLLIGRNMLEEGLLIVDVSKTFTGKPNCPDVEK